MCYWLKANGDNLGGWGSFVVVGFTLTPIAMLVNHNFITWHGKLCLILLLIHYFHWIICTYILMNQRLNRLNYVKIVLLFVLFFSCSFIFSILSLLHAAVANILWREQGTNINVFFIFFYIIMKCSSFVPRLFHYFFIVYSYSNYLPPLQYLRDLV